MGCRLYKFSHSLYYHSSIVLDTEVLKNTGKLVVLSLSSSPKCQRHIVKDLFLRQTVVQLPQKTIYF